MKDTIENIFGFLYTLSMGDYIFFISMLIVLFALLYVIYLIKRDEEVNINKCEEVVMLEKIKNEIEKDYKPEEIELTDYEKEQEENAIISYDELIMSKNKISVSYDEEYVSETNEVLVKKINLNGANEITDEVSTLQVKLMSYDKEEAFLQALKQLQQNLLN